MASFDERDAAHLRRAIELAREARGRGDDPFGAVLVAGDGRVLAEGQNTEHTERDVTGHAESNLIRDASRSVDAGTFASSSLYASGEPCAMCSAAIFFAGVGRVVYGASAARISEIRGSSLDDGRPALRLPIREVLAAGTRPTDVVGPALEEEAVRVFGGAPR
jgi:tRNA(Arg) A34 adenosine deaminase TadA